MLTILIIRSDGWLHAIASSGKQGLVPKNYLEVIDFYCRCILFKQIYSRKYKTEILITNNNTCNITHTCIIEIHKQ